MPRGQKPNKTSAERCFSQHNTSHHPSGGDPTHVDPVAMPRKLKEYLKEIFELKNGDDSYVHWLALSLRPNRTQIDHVQSVPSIRKCPVTPTSTAHPIAESYQIVVGVSFLGPPLAPSSPLLPAPPPLLRIASSSFYTYPFSPLHGRCWCVTFAPKSVLSVFSFSPYPCAPQRSPLHTRSCSHTHTRSHAHSHAHSHTYLHTHTHTHTRRPGTGPRTPCISPADMLYT